MKDNTIDSLKDVFNEINKNGMIERNFDFRKGFNSGLKLSLEIIKKEIKHQGGHI